MLNRGLCSEDSSTVKAFVAFVHCNATPLPRPRRLLEEVVHAVRADPHRVHDADVMHAPEKKILLKGSSLQSFQRRNDCAEGFYDDGLWLGTLALLGLRSLDAFSHGG